MYLEGLSEEEDIPFRIQQGPGQGGREDAAGAPEGPAVRKVAAGVAVIDLDAMRQELEANPAARRRT